jgi:Homotrimeric ring hydroxylase
LLDEGAVALGIHRTGESNWRIACENGFDNAHILVHRRLSEGKKLGYFVEKIDDINTARPSGRGRK